MASLPAEPEPSSRRRRSIPYRIIRTLCVLTALAGLIALTAWIAMVEVPARRLPGAVAALEAKGESLDLVALAPPPIPDDQNAAVLLAKAFRILTEVGAAERAVVDQLQLEMDATGRLELVTHPYWSACDAWTEAEATEQEAVFREYEDDLRAYLAAREPALDVAEEALRRPACRFDLPYHDVNLLNSHTEHYGPLRALARALDLRASIRAMDGDGPRALADCERIIDLGRTLQGEPLLISYLVRQGIDSFAPARAERVLTTAMVPSAPLRSLGAVFETEAAELDLVSALRGARAETYALLYATFHEPWATEPDTGPIPKEHDDITKAYERQRQSYFMKRYVAAGLLHVLLDLTRIVDAAALPAADAVKAVETIEAEYPEPRTWGIFRPRVWAEMWVNSFGDLIRRHIHEGVVAKLRAAAVGCRVAADMAEGGAPPDTLADVPAPLRTDPFTERDLLLHRTVDSIIVYSVGMNGRDDRGVFEKYNLDRDPQIKDDIAFTVPLRRGEDAWMPQEAEVASGV